jgi:hypothetical protein
VASGRVRLPVFQAPTNATARTVWQVRDVASAVLLLARRSVAVRSVDGSSEMGSDGDGERSKDVW